MLDQAAPPEETLADLADAYGGAQDAAPEYDEFGDLIERLPTKWTAAHVNKRLIDGLTAIMRVVNRPGPKPITTAWPSFMTEFAGNIDEREMELRRRADRPTAIMIAMAEEAIYWPIQYLAEGDQRTDALQLWLMGQVSGFNIERALHRRRLLADEMIRLLRGAPPAPELDEDRLKAAARGVAATANVQLGEAREKARAARSERQLAAARADALWARQHAKERLARIIDRERLIRKPKTEDIDRAEVMPGKVFWRQTLDKARWAAAGSIADGLRRTRVLVR